MNLFTWTPLEAWANAFTVICIFLAGRNSVHTWWTGLVAVGLFGALFYDAKLYADVTLQVFFAITSIVGWYNWRRIGITTSPITKTNTTNIFYMFGAAAIFAGLYGLLLHIFTDAWAPFIDSGVLTFSILGQFLLMRRKLETWYVWVMVNLLSVPLYFSRELYLTAGLYSVFLVHAVWAISNWNREMKSQMSKELVNV